MFIRDPWASRSSPTATKLNPFGISNACQLQSRPNLPTTLFVKTLAAMMLLLVEAIFGAEHKVIMKDLDDWMA